ncbi:NmrA/HSCARG family protein [Kibdelosporangium philippinense]|uniref:NmrA/HSCARG family protein n=1 Tax=Kibdelosporangium philippinense TaxID=211113 RepID=A0ABS8ZJ46_9PSEU|nr:NmrA/HSCARG family protein [Kibdelosporangium philippinense]MCE7007791.1 NmrA/HSCARG family protein [Kibdelosporangium philippinense]
MTILVTGATGRQGGATARRLLAEGKNVHALVRDRDSKAALDLAKAGAELAVGDMDDRGSLDAAIEGASGVFSIQPAPGDPTKELQRGINVADAARAAKVDHLVYASVASADLATGVPHWESKWQIEQHIRRIGIPATILRPVAFMDTFASLDFPWPDDQLIQLVAVDDIGALATAAFDGQFIGEVIELAGDELTPSQIKTAMDGQKRPEVLTQQRFAGWNADIPVLRKRFPWLKDFKTWLEA